MNTVPDGGHYDLDTLAQLDEGLLADAEADAANSHVADCGECSQQLGRLRTTRALLSTLPAETMPPAVAARIDDALKSAGSGSTATTIVPIGARRSWRAWMRSPALAGAAAVVVVGLLVAGVVVGGLGGKSHNGNSAATNGAANRPAGSGGVSTDALRAAGIKEWQTGSNYTAATMSSLVPRLVTTSPSAQFALRAPGSSASGSSAAGSLSKAAPAAPPTPSATGGQPVVSIEQMRSSRLAVAECGHILANDPTTVPLAVDFARFQGQPAAIVVMPAIDAPGSVDAYVLKGSCSSGALFQFYRVKNVG